MPRWRWPRSKGRGEPKQLELVDGHHFADYQGPGFDKAAATTAAFFARYL